MPLQWHQLGMSRLRALLRVGSYWFAEMFRFGPDATKTIDVDKLYDIQDH